MAQNADKTVFFFRLSDVCMWSLISVDPLFHLNSECFLTVFIGLGYQGPIEEKESMLKHTCSSSRFLMVFIQQAAILPTIKIDMITVNWIDEIVGDTIYRIITLTEVKKNLHFLKMAAN